MDYAHFNPVKHGFVAHRADWLYSTLRKCVALGLYDPAWAPADNNDISSGKGDATKGGGMKLMVATLAERGDVQRMSINLAMSD